MSAPKTVPRLLIIKVLTKMPSVNFNRYRIVEVTPTIDGPRWRFTDQNFATFQEAQAKVKAIREEWQEYEERGR